MSDREEFPKSKRVMDATPREFYEREKAELERVWAERDRAEPCHHGQHTMSQKDAILLERLLHESEDREAELEARLRAAEDALRLVVESPAIQYLDDEKRARVLAAVGGSPPKEENASN